MLASNIRSVVSLIPFTCPTVRGLCACLVLATDFRVYLTHEVLSQKQRQEAAAIKTTLELKGGKQNKLQHFAGPLLFKGPEVFSKHQSDITTHPRYSCSNISTYTKTTDSMNGNIYLLETVLNLITETT